MIENEGGEATFEDFFTLDFSLNFHDPFLPLSDLKFGLENHCLTLTHRSQKANFRGSEHDVGVVDGGHRGVIGGAKEKAAVNQAFAIGQHRPVCRQDDLRVARSHAHDSTAQTLIDCKMRMQLHS